MTIDTAALGAMANLGFIQRAWQCVWTGMYLTAPSTDIQLTFLMSSPYDPVFNICRWRGHFGNGVDQSVPLLRNAISKYTEYGHWSSREKELSRVSG